MSGDFNVTVEKLLLKWLPGITIASMKWIHQLDYATSGVLCIGLNRKAAAVACNAFEHRQVKKEYIAVLQGHIDMNRWKKKKKIIDQDKEKFGSCSYKAPSDVNFEDSPNYKDSQHINDDGKGNSIKKNNEWYNRENNTKCIDDSNEINDSMKSNINTYETSHDNHKRKISKLQNNKVVDIEIKHGNHFNQTISIINDNDASNSLVMDDNHHQLHHHNHYNQHHNHLAGMNSNGMILMKNDHCDNISKSKQWQDEIMEKNLLICYDNFHAYLIKNGWKKIDQSIENDKVDNNDDNQRLIFDELKASDSKLYHEIEKLSKHGLEKYRKNSKLRKSLRKCLKSLKINTELIESNHLSFDSNIISRDSNMNVENNSSSGTDVVDDIGNNDDDDQQNKLLYSINIENVKKLQQMFSSAVTTDNKHGIPRIYRVNISNGCDITSTDHDHHLFDCNEENDDHDHDSHIHPSDSCSSISNNLCRIMIDIPIAEVKGKVIMLYHTFSNHISKYCNCCSR